MIPLFRPMLTGDAESAAVTRVLRSHWWALGPETEKFEEEFAAYTGTRYAVAVNSGTMALKLAARAMDLTDGLVVVPALTFISTALVMQQLSNKVVFADIDEDTLCLDWDEVLYKLRSQHAHQGPRGVVPVWYGGHVQHAPNLPAVTHVLEDCAHAAGSVLAGKIGRAAAWSFQAVKNLATGDGGMVTTDDEHIAREVRRMRWLGIDRTTWDRDKDSRVGYGWDYDISALDGEKAHMNDIQAAIGRVQLAGLDVRNSLRRFIANTYRNYLKDLDWLELPPVRRDESSHLFVVRVKECDRDRFIQHMIRNDVSAGVHYKPLTHYKDKSGEPLFGLQDKLPVTERVWKTLVTLPLFPDMTNAEVDQVITAVRAFS